MHIPTEVRIKRLNGFCGMVEEAWNRRIQDLIRGKRVLEIGCGYGTLVNRLTKNGFDVVGIDLDTEAIGVGKGLYKGVDLKVADIYSDFDKGTKFDTVILKQVIHHLDIEKALRRIDNLCKSEIIIFDPNPTPVVKFCRLIARHVDPEAKIKDVISALKSLNYRIEKVQYSDVFAMPLSGGYVGIQIIPDNKRLNKFIIDLDRIFSKVFNILKLNKIFCWRYLIYARKG